MNLINRLKYFSKINKPYALSKEVLKAYNATRTKAQQKHLCHAPFKSMLFANNGRVLACCFNRQAVLGEYPKQTLNEIWFSSQAQNLRKYIDKNNLSNGCFTCKNQLFNKEFSTVKARMFDHLPDSSSGFPTTMEFDLDNTCNLECVMCNADNSSAIRNKSDLYGMYNSPFDASFVKDLEPFLPHLHQASFAGGEPFLTKLYFDIWEMMIVLNPNIRINITTNATVLNDKIKSLLSRGNFEISVSLDSINKETYSQIRKNAHYETVMENLIYFHNYCKGKGTFFGVWACPLRNNKYEIPELFNYFGERNIEVFLHTVWVPPKVTLWNTDSKELKELLAFYEKQTLKEETEIQSKNKQRFQEYIALVKSWQVMAEMREQNNKRSETPLQNQNYLVQILEQQFRNKGFETSEITVKINEYHNKIAFCKAHLPQPIYNEALNSLSQYPDEFIFQIFEAGSPEMIADFFKYLVR